MNRSPEDRERMALHQQYVSDVFHTLGQPLTELQMSLEIAMHKEMDVEGYRAVIRQALAATQRVIQSAKFVRQLAEAEDPGARGELVDFSLALREAIDEFEPVAECSHVEIGRVIEEGLLISADVTRMGRALFLLMDHSLHAAMPGTRMHVIAQACSGFAVIEIGTVAQELLWRSAEQPPLTVPNDSTHRALQLAERMIAAVGGTLRESSDLTGVRIEIRIPLARQAYRQNETGTLVS